MLVGRDIEGFVRLVEAAAIIGPDDVGCDCSGGAPRRTEGDLFN